MNFSKTRKCFEDIPCLAPSGLALKFPLSFVDLPACVSISESPGRIR